MKFLVLFRCFSFQPALFKRSVANDLKGKSKSSQEWILRQIKDPYVEKSKIENYRCRSAFKLLEIDNKHKIFSHGQTVIDCGAAPGSWTQVAVSKTNAAGKVSGKPKGLVIGLDRQPIFVIEGATLLGGHDFTSEKSQAAIRQALGQNKADVVLSDMAPNATGIKTMDHDAIIDLAYAFVRFGVGVNKEGGTLLVKILEGGSSQKFEKDVSRFYQQVKWVKPNASRSDSSEIFLLARGFKGLKA